MYYQIRFAVPVSCESVGVDACSCGTITLEHYDLPLIPASHYSFDMKGLPGCSFVWKAVQIYTYRVLSSCWAQVCFKQSMLSILYRLDVWIGTHAHALIGLAFAICMAGRNRIALPLYVHEM